MNRPWHVLVVDDEEEAANGTAEQLNRAAASGSVAHAVIAVAEQSFDNALHILNRGGIDLLVLDVFAEVEAGQPSGAMGSEPKGRTVFDMVRSTRFLPIIFLTALPNEVRHYEKPPFVQVVAKSDETERLFECVNRCLSSSFPPLHRSIQDHIDAVSRDFMIEFVEQHWAELSDREQDIAHLLMRRLGVSFDGGVNLVTSWLDGASPPVDTVPPIRYYVVPPPNIYRMGDILRLPKSDDGDDENADRWYVIMTPSCDLVEGRRQADSIVLAECLLIESFGEYASCITPATRSRTSLDKLERLLKSRPQNGQQNRYFYLPHAWTLPDMMVDLQKISNIPHKELGKYNKEAALDNPYAEALSHQCHSYLGRVGTPDLDLEASISRMFP